MAVNVSTEPLDARWDVAAIRSGALVCCVVAVPITVLAAVINSDSGVLNAVLFFAAMIGFVIGGGCAAWVQRVGTPISHSVVTAGGTYLVVQAFFVTLRLIRGADVNWLGVVFTLGLVLLAGVLGGIYGSRLQANGWTPSERARSTRASR